LVAHFALQNTKFGSEKGKVQNPARIPPQTPLPPARRSDPFGLKNCQRT